MQKKPKFHILAGPRAYFVTTGWKQPWRRITLKMSKGSTARTDRKNEARLRFANEHGLRPYLMNPDQLDALKAAHQAAA